jgi:hypothetical protein
MNRPGAIELVRRREEDILEEEMQEIQKDR